MTPNELLHGAFALVVLVCGVGVFLNAAHHVKFKFSSKTPLGIRVGASLVAAGVIGFLLQPFWCGGLIVIGQAVLIVGERRRYSIFSRNSGGPVVFERRGG